MAGCLILYTSWTLYSGVSLFDQWAIPLLNFISGREFLGSFSSLNEHTTELISLYFILVF